MAKFSNQKLKLLYTLDILKKYSDEEHPLNSEQIAEKLLENGIEAERKSIYSDISSLTDYGYDIIKASGKQRGWFLGDRELEIPEIYLLCDAVRSADFISAKKTRELLSKLNGMLSVFEAKRRKNAVFFTESAKCENEEIYYNIDKISRAIEEKKQITLMYSQRAFSSEREFEKDKKEMQISPYALTWNDDHYYVIGNYSKYNNLLHLRLDRINTVNITEVPMRHFSEVSEYKDFFDVADYTNKLFGMHSGVLTEIELQCKKTILEPVLDRFTENIFMKKVTDTEFSFSTKAMLSEALVTWILNYGSNITVTKPEELREMVKKRAMDVLKNYN